MKEILKMVNFDYITVKGAGANYVWMLIAICIVLSCLGMFPAALGLIILPLGIFSPMQTFRKGDFMKIYGLIPVERETVMKALFLEIAVPQIIGGIICEILLLISHAVGEAHILPSLLQEYVYDKAVTTLDEYGMVYGDVYLLAAAAMALITIIVLFFYMILEIKGETFAMVCCVPFVLIIGAAVVVYVTLFNDGSKSVPTIGDMLPDSGAVKLAVSAAAFAAAVLAETLLCGLAIKKTDKKEI